VLPVVRHVFRLLAGKEDGGKIEKNLNSGCICLPDCQSGQP